MSVGKTKFLMLLMAFLIAMSGNAVAIPLETSNLDNTGKLAELDTWLTTGDRYQAGAYEGEKKEQEWFTVGGTVTYMTTMTWGFWTNEYLTFGYYTYDAAGDKVHTELIVGTSDGFETRNNFIPTVHGGFGFYVDNTYWGRYYSESLENPIEEPDGDKRGAVDFDEAVDFDGARNPDNDHFLTYLNDETNAYYIAAEATPMAKFGNWDDKGALSDVEFTDFIVKFQPVPEPGTSFLLGTGLLAALFLVRGNRNRRHGFVGRGGRLPGMAQRFGEGGHA